MNWLLDSILEEDTEAEINSCPVDAAKVERLGKAEDPTGAAAPEDLAATEVHWTADGKDLSDADFYIIAVPTPIDEQRRPDLSALRAAARIVGKLTSEDTDLSTEHDRHLAAAYE